MLVSHVSGLIPPADVLYNYAMGREGEHDAQRVHFGLKLAILLQKITHKITQESESQIL